MLYSARLRTLRMLALAAVLITGAAWAQPVSYTLAPSPLEEGGNIFLTVSHGTESQPVLNALSLTYVYAYRGFQPDEGAQLSADATGSWFANDNNWSFSYSWDTARKELTLVLSRTNGVPRSGFGFVVEAYGGPIIICDDYNKQALAPMRLVSMHVEQARGLALTFSGRTLRPTAVGEARIESARLIDLSGRTLGQAAGAAPEFPLDGIASGTVCVLQVRLAGGAMEAQKFLVP
ncbi:MAG: hypothetical protein NW241_03580 [Bacteroidia bacterium]|nr:hypothetical protein [Bacteroidia bacterium]